MKKINAEIIDGQIQSGYGYLEEEEYKKAADIWLKAWKSITLLLPKETDTVDKADDLFCDLTQSLFNWSQDLVNELYNVSLKHPAYIELGIDYCNDFLARFKDEYFQVQFSLEKAVFLFRQGRKAESIGLFEEQLEKYPEDENVYYMYANTVEEETERIYLLAIKRGVADENMVENLMNHYDEQYGLREIKDEKRLLEFVVDTASEGDYTRALGYIKKILAFNPGSYHALFLKYRINKKNGKIDRLSLNSAYEEAKKQKAGKEVLKLMRDEIREDVFITEPVMDCGHPMISEGFFDDKFLKFPTAAAMLHFTMSNVKVDDLVANMVDRFLTNERKDKIEEEKKEIKEINNPDAALGLFNRGIDTVNEQLLIKKALEYSGYMIPKIISKLRENTDDSFVEFGVRLIKEADNNSYSGLIIKVLPSIKHAYTLSTVCLLLGFIGGKDAVKPIWDIYNHFKENYPNESFDQGPLFALLEFKRKGLLSN